MLSTREWIEKDEPKAPKRKRGEQCPLCDHHVRLNGSLKRHVEDVHGQGTWAALQDALTIEAEERKSNLRAQVERLRK